MENQNRHVYLMVYGAAIAAIYVALTMSFSAVSYTHLESR